MDYVSRVFSGFTELEIYSKAFLNKENVLISGPTGSGKTFSVSSYAEKSNLNFYSIPCNSAVEPSQLLGRVVISEDGKFKWQDGPVTKIVRQGGVLLFNEINFLSRGVSEVLFSLLDDRRHLVLMENDGEVVKASDDLIVFADMNDGYLGTHELNEALKDRFSIKLIFNYSDEIEEELVKSKNFKKLIKNLRKMSEDLSDKRIRTPVSTRMMVNFEKQVRTYNLEFAVDNFINQFSAKEREGVKYAFEVIHSNLKLDYES